MDENKTNILIISDNTAGIALAKKLKKNKFAGKIYITSEQHSASDEFEFVDIRNTDETELLKFALQNEIHLTILTSESAINADIAAFFAANGQRIFAPCSRAAKLCLDKASCKKFLYKIHAQTSKFGVFDKLQQASEWLNNATFPVLIRCCKSNKNITDRLVCPTMKFAVDFLENLFAKGETTILAEEFQIGNNFTIYFITDGYAAIPITSVRNYKFEQDGDSGIYTNGTGCFTPDYTVSDTIISRTKNIIQKTLEYLDKNGNPYIGIIGIECTMTGEDKFYVNEFRTFLQDYDAVAVLNTIDDDLIKIFNACIDGLFADEYETIQTNNSASVTVVLQDDIQLNQPEEDVEIETSAGKTYITKNASNIARAKKALREFFNEPSLGKVKFRRDIIRDFEY